jgi:hypothetical protein
MAAVAAESCDRQRVLRVWYAQGDHQVYVVSTMLVRSSPRPCPSRPGAGDMLDQVRRALV